MHSHTHVPNQLSRAIYMNLQEWISKQSVGREGNDGEFQSGRAY